jgi:N-acetylneuraminate synthase
MAREIRIGEREIGDGHPIYVVAEIGINHNGDVELAKNLIDAAVEAGVDAVKFQKRTPELCVPIEQREQMRETPWGYISYIDYRYRTEFEEEQYGQIDGYCRERGVTWFASVWDIPSVDFMEAFDPACYKIPSAGLTDHDLLRRVLATGRPLILSTGMSTMEQIEVAVEILGTENLLITHTTSTYPCDPEELNLSLIPRLAKITLDRSMWGTDQAASVEPGGFRRLVKYIRVTEQSLGDGVKHVYDSELPSMQRLRRINP